MATFIFKELNFKQTVETIKEMLIGAFGDEHIHDVSKDDDKHYSISADYGKDIIIDWTVFASSLDKLMIGVTVDSFYEDDPDFEKKVDKVFSLLGLRINDSVLKSKGTYTGKDFFRYLNPEEYKLKKMGKFKDLLDI